MPSPNRNLILLFIAVLAGALWQLYLVDDNLGTSWPQNVEHNWEQFGFLALHGQLVCNPGGWQIHTAPDVYKGMSPLCLWPAHLSWLMFGWTGAGTLVFHLFMTLAVFWGIWRMLGRDQLAFLVAAVAVLCPGYDRWQKLLDPNAISVLFGIPYAAILLSQMQKPQIGIGAWGGLFVLTILFISLNWTTAWVLGPMALMLFGLPQVSRRSLITYIVLAGLASVIFVGVSVAAKAGGAQQGGGHLNDFLRGYLWGNIGYGEGLTTGKAFGLLAFTNGVGLLLLWLTAAAILGLNLTKTGPAAGLVLAPLTLAIADVVIMRNYFGHHPWMASPVLLAGIVFSLVVLRGQLRRDPAGPDRLATLLPIDTRVLALACAAGVVYGLAVLSFFRANEGNTLALISLIRHNSQRGDAVLLVKETDPQLAQIASRFDEIFDRHVEVVPDLRSLPGRGPAVVLSGNKIPSLRLVAAEGGSGGASFMRAAADWFNRKIAQRRRGDRLELGDSYFIYAAKP